MSRIVSKVIGVVGILLVMYLLVGFFFWHYYEATDWSEVPKFFEMMKPLIVFFQPAVDLYSGIYGWFLGLLE